MFLNGTIVIEDKEFKKIKKTQLIWPRNFTNSYFIKLRFGRFFSDYCQTLIVKK